MREPHLSVPLPLHSSVLLLLHLLSLHQLRKRYRVWFKRRSLFHNRSLHLNRSLLHNKSQPNQGQPLLPQPGQLLDSPRRRKLLDTKSALIVLILMIQQLSMISQVATPLTRRDNSRLTSRQNQMNRRRRWIPIL